MKIPHSLPHLAAALALTTCFGANAAELSAASAAQYAQANFREYFDLLALPNDAIVPADVRKNVEFLEASFQKRGFKTQQ
ncbi:MAG: acetylornithine deacetylase, partial [Variovorax sp.]